jgi:hypothetical protein
MPWLWVIYTLAFTGLTIWTAILFFKKRSAITWWLLAGGLVLSLGSLLYSAIVWVMPLLGLGDFFDPATHKPVHEVLVEVATQARVAGGLCFQVALWFLLRRNDEGARRIAELEATLHGNHPQESMHPTPPPYHG